MICAGPDKPPCSSIHTLHQFSGDRSAFELEQNILESELLNLTRVAARNCRYHKNLIRWYANVGMLLEVALDVGGIDGSTCDKRNPEFLESGFTLDPTCRGFLYPRKRFHNFFYHPAREFGAPTVDHIGTPSR